MDSSNIFYSAH